MGKLTAIAVKNAKPGRHADGKGLYLLVKPKVEDDGSISTGSRSWVLRIVLNGRRRDFGLGPVDLVTLQEARDKAVEGRRLARAGLDPSVEWKRRPIVIPTFEEAATQLHENIKGGFRNAKHAAQWLTTLKTYAFPGIGKLQVDQIQAPLIQSVVLQPIWLTKPETARRVRQRVLTVLDWCHTQGWRAAAPSTKTVSTGLQAQKRNGADDDEHAGHFASMPYADLPAFMAKLRGMETSVGRKALEYLILTAARSGEVRGATWAEVADGNEWTIPGSRMKAGKRQIEPLSDAAKAVLAEMRPLVSNAKAPLIFPGAKGKPLSDATIAKAMRSVGSGRATVHGMRSSFRDWAAENGYPDTWAEKALAHGVRDQTEAAYRRSSYLEQRRKMMGDWADFLAGKSKVVRMVPKAAAQ